MRLILDWHGRASVGTIKAARTSQAVVIEAVDRLVQASGDRRTVNRMLSMHLDAVDAVLGDQVQLLEQSYDAVEHLVLLHREFARRLLEVVDKRDNVQLAEPASHENLATIHPLRTGGRSA